MRQIGLITAPGVCTAASVAAQTKGKVSVGASVTYAILTDSEVESLVGYGPFVRAIVGFVGYSWNRPDIVYRDTSGREFRNQWTADAVLLSVGACYSLF